MAPKLGILKRRKLSPERLQAARLKAGYTNVEEICRQIGIRRLAYNRWERAPGLAYFDFYAFQRLLALFETTYEEVTDEIPEGEQRSAYRPLPQSTPLRRKRPAPAQASA